MKSEQCQRTFAVWAHEVSRARVICGSPKRCKFRATRKSSFAFVFIFFFVSAAAGNQATSANSTVRGTVFFCDSAGRQFPVAGAQVVLTGDTTIETTTNETGEYAFPAVPFGNYTVEAVSTGLKAVETVRVDADELRLVLELKPAEVSTSVVVTADRSDGKGAAPGETISDTTLRDAPSVDERFESSLPLVPGVVRGPDGHVNLKGTRDTQSGALVNSANVTDPVTGSPAMNLPVDVVSSWREYRGKFVLEF